MVNQFIEWLKENNWQVILNHEKFNLSRNNILNNYKNIPDSFFELIRCCKSINSADEQMWFLCSEDYREESNDAFKWNEFELMSLEAAQDDVTWKKEIMEWWKDKLPILLSVRDVYSYYAIDMGKNGTIIKGIEPEFEETVVVANDFDEFLRKIMNKTICL